HHVVSAAISLAGDDRYLWHGRLGVGEEQLRAMLDEAAIFLRSAGKEAWDIHEGDERNIEAVTEADEPRGFPARVAIEHACQDHRLVGDDADCVAAQPSEAGDNVFRVSRLD